MLADLRRLMSLKAHGNRLAAGFTSSLTRRFAYVLDTQPIHARLRHTDHFLCTSVDGTSAAGRIVWTQRDKRISYDRERRVPLVSIRGYRSNSHVKRFGKSYERKTNELFNDGNDSIAAEGHAALPLAAEIVDSVNRRVSHIDGRAAEIDARLAELERLAAVKIRDVDHAIDLEEDMHSSDYSANDGWYGRVAELGGTVQSQMPAAHQPGKTVQLYGSPDPQVPPSNVPCHGCGVHLHCVDPGIAGYIPSQIFVAATSAELKDILCQRCHLLDKFNIAIDVTVKPMEFKAIAEQIKKTSPALLLVIVDLTDLPNSLYDGFAELAGEHRPIYIIGNKVDLLPRDDVFHLKRVKDSVLQLCTERGISAKHIALISAKTGYGVENLITQLLNDWRLKGQVYILGCSNAGKSSLFNALLASDFCRIAARDVIQRATSSIWPGTTLSLLKFPIVNPKPFRLYQRIERLKKQHSEEREAEKIRRQQLKETGRSKYATLTGYIGQTSPSLRQAALQQYVEERHSTGFVAPSYVFDEIDSGGQSADGKSSSGTSWLQECVGREAVLERMRLKVAPYDDSTFKFWCYDTPGLINVNQVINYLNTEELFVLLNKNLIIPRTFRLKPSYVLFASGLGRLDYVDGNSPIYCTVFAADSVPVHVVSSEEAEQFYQSNIGTSKLGVPLGDENRLKLIPPLVGFEYKLSGIGWQESVADVVLSSIGWVSITTCAENLVTLKAFTPGGLGCVLRSPALLKYAVNLRGKRIRGTYKYHTRPPKFCGEK